MKKYPYTLGMFAGVGALLFAANTFKALPSVYDPDRTGIIASACRHRPTPPQLVIDGVQGIKLTELGYDKDGGHCSGGAPRFNVSASDGFHFVGACTNGTPSGFPAPGWTTFRFSDAQAFPPIDPNATINSIAILFDEEGSVVIDNIDVNGTLMGKPSNAK